MGSGKVHGARPRRSPSTAPPRCATGRDRRLIATRQAGKVAGSPRRCQCARPCRRRSRRPTACRRRTEPDAVPGEDDRRRILARPCSVTRAAGVRTMVLDRLDAQGRWRGPSAWSRSLGCASLSTTLGTARRRAAAGRLPPVRTPVRCATFPCRRCGVRRRSGRPHASATVVFRWPPTASTGLRQRVAAGRVRAARCHGRAGAAGRDPQSRAPRNRRRVARCGRS